MHFFTALLLLSSATSTLALPANVQYATFEQVKPPAGWRAIRRTNPRHPITLKIHLTQQNVDAFEKRVIDISTPGHELYGKHMTHEEVKAMLAPKDETVSAVTGWLKSLGLGNNVKVEHDWVYVHTDVQSAEHLLKTEYHTYDHDEHGAQVRTTKYSLPAHLHEHVNMIHPTVVFGNGRGAIKTQNRPAPRHTRRQDDTDASCDSTITPDCLKKLYNVGSYTLPTTGDTGLLAVAGYLEQYAQQDDLQSFAKEYLNGAKVGFECTGVNGGLCTQHPDGDFTEANLDIQYTIALSNPLKNAYYSTGGRPPIVNGSEPENDNEPYLEFVTWLLKQSPLPHTVTNSYGEPETTVPLNYMQTVCNLFAQAGAQGISVMFSSGDSGPGGDCPGQKFEPTFPAACPFVTSVGGTHGFTTEKAVGLSSGGFSNTFAIPDYQKDAVAKWFSSAPEAKSNAKYYNATGRGFPDVAAQGEDFHVFVGGHDSLVSGTSASSPAFAGIIGLINGDRVASGKPPMGFLNPWIYGAGKAGFRDITSGNSVGCYGSISGAKWSAVSGWDPVTGVGVANFQQMLTLARDYTPSSTGGSGESGSKYPSPGE